MQEQFWYSPPQTLHIAQLEFENVTEFATRKFQSHISNISFTGLMIQMCNKQFRFRF